MRVLALNPGGCLDVERTFTFQPIDLDRWSTIAGIAWAQTPSDGFGEVYQAAKTPFLLPSDGFEAGDTSAWSATVP